MFVMVYLSCLASSMFTSFIMELLVYPAIYELWRWHFYVKKEAA